ncbi:MAG: hypothetical protein FJ118_08495 [Deltaproteobacteria bacterium]|nr:hypothetical protein [Deltaproteobacteria bacterium]
MRKLLFACSMAAFVTLALAASALAFGEDVLAAKGEYTFFIKPDPKSCVTYYQKMVPCVENKTVIIPRKFVQTFPHPVLARQKERVLVTETPVGCAEGAGPCVHCFPQPSCRPETREPIVPRIVPVNVVSVVPEPVCVPQHTKLPQWFAVQEFPMPPPVKVRKVGSGG